MNINFIVPYLKELYLTGTTGNKREWFQPEITVKYRKCIDFLKNAQNEEDLMHDNGLHFEKLDGKLKSQYSIRLNKQFRLEFEIDKSTNSCEIIQLSDHYKSI